MTGRSCATNRKRLAQELETQLDFLAASVARYDAGHTHEAKRIALALRLLFHDRGNSSISLLRLLDTTAIQILSIMGRTPPIFASRGIGAMLGIGIVRQRGDGALLIPRSSHPDRFPAKWLSREDWWTEIIAVHGEGETLSREIVVRTVADKDGGAHVQAQLPTSYERVVRGDFGRWLQFPDSPSGGFALEQAPSVALRDMAYEVLNSPGLVQLAAVARESRE